MFKKILLGCAAVASITSAEAATIVYHANSTALGNALTNVVTDDFASAIRAPGLSLSGETLKVTGGLVSHVASGTRQATFAFADGVYGFGGDVLIGPSSGVGLRVDLLLADGTTQRINDFLVGSPRFYGFTSDVAIKAVNFSSRNGGLEAWDFDNLVFGQAPGAVPEPASWAMMIAGFGLCGQQMRRRPRKAAEISARA